jgi:hypothetical protein
MLLLLFCAQRITIDPPRARPVTALQKGSRRSLYQVSRASSIPLNQKRRAHTARKVFASCRQYESAPRGWYRVGRVSRRYPIKLLHKNLPLKRCSHLIDVFEVALQAFFTTIVFFCTSKKDRFLAVLFYPEIIFKYQLCCHAIYTSVVFVRTDRMLNSNGFCSLWLNAAGRSAVRQFVDIAVTMGFPGSPAPPRRSRYGGIQPFAVWSPSASSICSTTERPLSAVIIMEFVRTPAVAAVAVGHRSEQGPLGQSSCGVFISINVIQMPTPVFQYCRSG